MYSSSLELGENVSLEGGLNSCIDATKSSEEQFTTGDRGTAIRHEPSGRETHREGPAREVEADFRVVQLELLENLDSGNKAGR